jgi:hypothetical protein
VPDVVVTVPKQRWSEWITEGDLPGEEWSGLDSYFLVGGRPPRIEPGERVYIVALGRLRGYAPLVRCEAGNLNVALIRQGGAVAVTINESIRGFRGWRYRWWEREQEVPFPDWRESEPINTGLFAESSKD